MSETPGVESRSVMSSLSNAGSLKRGVLLLRIMATAGARGMSLTEIAVESSLPHSSVHRLLKQLMAERFVEYESEARRYRIGPLTFELGLAGSTIFDIRDLCEPAMRVVAETTEDTVYLMIRSGFDVVCVHRQEGAFPIRALVLEVGSRRPLGVGAAGLAILSMIEEAERLAIIDRISKNLSGFSGLTPDVLTQDCERARVLGAGFIRNTLSLGVSAVGVAFRDLLRQPIGAFSVAAVSQRMSTSRMKTIAADLRSACDDVEKRLRARKRGAWCTGSSS